MGVIRNAANTLIKGRVGQTTYYISGGQQIARQSRNDSNYGETARRSYSQQERRIMWANLVNFYKASAIWMPKAFETKKRNQTDYNKFMQLNLEDARIAFTKAEAAAGACVVDEFLISQGSIPAIAITQSGSAWKTDLSLGSLEISASTTVKAFTDALLANNSSVRDGMQISFVVYEQSIDTLSTPRILCQCYEVTLSTTSTEPLRKYLPEICSTTVDGCLGTSTSIATGGFAFILSELVAGALRVSTQRLITNNTALITQYTSSVQQGLAMSSYGLDREVILSPATTNAQSYEPAPIYIQFVVVDHDGSRGYYYPGYGVRFPTGYAYNNPIYIKVSGIVDQTVTSVVMNRGTGSQAITATTATYADEQITATFEVSGASDSTLVRGFTVTLSDESVHEITF